MLFQKLTVAALILLLPSGIYAQKRSQPAPKVYTHVPQMPIYPGGIDSLMHFMATNIRYPESAIQFQAEGKMYVRFVVNPQGAMQNFEILKSLHPALDTEALRVLKLMPHWKPGRLANQPVHVSYVMPLTFKLRDDATPIPSE